MALSWYPRFPGDYARKTSHLTMLEHGAYNLLIDYYYSTGEPLPANADANAPALAIASNPRLYRICRAVTSEEQRAVDYVIDQFFTLSDGKYHQSRIDEELAERQEISQKRRGAWEVMQEKKKQVGGKRLANAGASAKASATAKRTAKDRQMHSTTTTTVEDTIVSSPPNPQITEVVEIEAVDVFRMPDGTVLNFDQLFERYWNAYPNIRDRGHKGQAKEQLKTKLKKGESYETIGRGIAKYRIYCDATGEKQPDMFRWIRDSGYNREYTIPVNGTQRGGSGGYSIQAVYDQALNDPLRPKPETPDERRERLARLGLEP